MKARVIRFSKELFQITHLLHYYWAGGHFVYISTIALYAYTFSSYAISSLTFLLVSLLMAYANYKIHQQTNSSVIMTLCAMIGLATATGMIIYFEMTTQVEQLYFIAALYVLLIISAWSYSNKNWRLTCLKILRIK